MSVEGTTAGAGKVVSDLTSGAAKVAKPVLDGAKPFVPGAFQPGSFTAFAPGAAPLPPPTPTVPLPPAGVAGAVQEVSTFAKVMGVVAPVLEVAGPALSILAAADRINGEAAFAEAHKNDTPGQTRMEMRKHFVTRQLVPETEPQLTVEDFGKKESFSDPKAEAEAHVRRATDTAAWVRAHQPVGATHPAPSATVEVHSSPNRPVVVPYREGFEPNKPATAHPGPWRADGPTGTAHPTQQAPAPEGHPSQNLASPFGHVRFPRPLAPKVPISYLPPELQPKPRPPVIRELPSEFPAPLPPFRRVRMEGDARHESLETARKEPLAQSHGDQPPQQLAGTAAAVKLPPNGMPPAAGAPPAGGIPGGKPKNDNGEAPPVKLYPMPPRSEESRPRDSQGIKPVKVIAPQFITKDDRYEHLWEDYNRKAAKIGQGKTSASSVDPMMSTDPKADVNKKEKSSNTDAAEGSPPTNLGSTNAALNEVIALRITGGQTTPNFGRIMGEAVQEMTEAIQGGRATDLDSFMGIAAHARGEVQWRIYPHSLPSFGVLREPGSATFTPIAEGYPRYHGLILEAMQRNSFGSPDTRASDAVLTEFGLDTFLFGRMFTAARGAEIYKREISIDGNKVPLTLYVRAPDGEVTLIHPAVSSYTNEPYTKAKRYCDKLYNELKDLNTHLTPEETIRKLALLHYTMAHLMPYARGSAAITHTTIVALAKARGFQVGRIKPDVQPDMEAFLRDPEDYVRNYPNMFDHTSASDSHVDQPSEPEAAPSSKTPPIRRW